MGPTARIYSAPYLNVFAQQNSDSTTCCQLLTLADGMKSTLLGMPYASFPCPLTQPNFPSFCDMHTRCLLLLFLSILSIRLLPLHRLIPLPGFSLPGIPFRSLYKTSQSSNHCSRWTSFKTHLLKSNKWPVTQWLHNYYKICLIKV